VHAVFVFSFCVQLLRAGALHAWVLYAGVLCAWAQRPQRVYVGLQKNFFLEFLRKGVLLKAMYFAIHVLDKANQLDRRISIREMHRQRLRHLEQENRLLLAGPLCQENGDPIGSLVVAEFENLEAAQAWVAADPYVLEGVYGQPDIRSFSQAFPRKT